MATSSSLTGAAAVALFCFAAGCTKSPPANVAAMVNNRAITYAELEKTYQSQQQQQQTQQQQQQPAATPENPNDDQVMLQKLEILRGLIDNETMMQRADK